MYKKRYASHLQKKLANDRAGRKTPKRTLKAIENNGIWVNHYTELLRQIKEKQKGLKPIEE